MVNRAVACCPADASSNLMLSPVFLSATYLNSGLKINGSVDILIHLSVVSFSAILSISFLN
jgi:hypothetical protein